MPILPENKLEILKKTIAEQFPEMKNVEPKIETKEITPNIKTAMKLGINMKRVPLRRQQVHIATFGTQIEADDGATIQKVIRATLDEDGNIIRISHSK